jgi:CubicO group peptidase (beta-lactamase class C family)
VNFLKVSSFGSLTLLFAALAVSPAQESAVDLQDLLEPIRKKHQLPALTAAAIQKTRILGSGAVGLRRLDRPEAVTIEDRWHLGSCTKSMTATLAAMLVERGPLTWTSTVGESFPELRETMDPQWENATLEQLLTHRSGAPAEPPANLWRNAFAQAGSPTEQRLAFVSGLLLRRPEALPGTKFIYSNQGYAIAGAMLERATGEAWETLMQKQLFPACLMNNAGFGAPASRENPDQPWGHAWKEGRFVPEPPGPRADNPPAIAPAGGVHCTIEEFARYAAWHARGERSGSATLRRESFLKLHTPRMGQLNTMAGNVAAGEHAEAIRRIIHAAGGTYAMGWNVLPRDWAGGNALTHEGSNTMFFAVMWLAPAKETAFVVATNSAGESAALACDEAIAAMIQRFLK